MRSATAPSLPLRRLGRIVGGGTPTPDEANWGGEIPFVTPPDLRPVVGRVVEATERTLTRAGAESGSSLVPANSVLLSIRAPIGYVARTSLESSFNQGCRALVPAEHVDASYLTYALIAAAPELEAMGRGTTFTELSAGQMAEVEVPVPSIELQRAIAGYLDHETAQIDKLIAEQQRLIELLAERRSGVVAGALDSRVGSGERLKWFINEFDIRAGDRATELPLMSVSISRGVHRRDEVSDEDARAESLANYKVCEVGDLVINRMRAFQGALGLAPEDGLVSPDYAVIKASPNLDRRWLAMVMKTPAFVAEMAKRVKGIGSADLGNARTPRINVSDLGEIRIDVPTLQEQTSEWTDLEDQLVRIDALLATAERLIGLAQERRSALITAAVTGQVDVRSVA